MRRFQEKLRNKNDAMKPSLISLCIESMHSVFQMLPLNIINLYIYI